MGDALKSKLSIDFDRAATGYASNALLQKEISSHLASFLLPNIDQNSVIIDSGCGTGFLADIMGGVAKQQIIAVDIAEQMCVLSKDKYKKTVNADFDKLPFAASYFDIYYSSMALQWSDDIRASFREAYRVLKPGGLMVFSIVADGSLSELRNAASSLGYENIVRNFIDTTAIQSALEKEFFIEINISEKEYIKYYCSVIELLKSIRKIGASSKSKAKYLGKDFISKIEAIYDTKYREARGLRQSWNILYVTARKQK